MNWSGVKPKITAEQVEMVKQRLAAGDAKPIIAEDLGLPLWRVQTISKGKYPKRLGGLGSTRGKSCAEGV